jgi:hypothetical protein
MNVLRQTQGDIKRGANEKKYKQGLATSFTFKSKPVDVSICADAVIMGQ